MQVVQSRKHIERKLFLIQEIQRVSKALSKTTSPNLERDYGKYLLKLRKELNYIEETYEKHN